MIINSNNTNQINSAYISQNSSDKEDQVKKSDQLAMEIFENLPVNELSPIGPEPSNCVLSVLADILAASAPAAAIALPTTAELAPARTPYLNKETFLNRRDINDLKKYDGYRLFVSESNHAFDTSELFQWFEQSGCLLNPYTMQPFTKADIEKFKRDPIINENLIFRREVYPEETRAYENHLRELVKKISPETREQFNRLNALFNREEWIGYDPENSNRILEERFIALATFKKYFDELDKKEKEALNELSYKTKYLICTRLEPHMNELLGRGSCSAGTNKYFAEISKLIEQYSS